MPNFYVSDFSGNDANDGSILKPFKTIQSAANQAKAGDTINIYYGIYRERVSPAFGGLSTNGKISPIIYKGIPDSSGNKPIVRGSVPWVPSTCEQENIWCGILADSMFPDKSHIDGANPFDVPSSVTPYGLNGIPELVISGITPAPNPKLSYCLGQVFVNDEMYIQKPLLEDMLSTEKSWSYDTLSKKLTVHFPTNCLPDYTIEITNQRRLFAPHVRSLRHINIDGFVFERCGNNYPNKFWVIPNNQQAGAVGTRCGRFWKIMNNIIRFATGIGIDWGNEGSSTQDLELGSNGVASGAYGNIISDNIISDNGAAGTASFMCNNFVFSNNVVERNNNLLFYGKQRWESAGLKVHCPRDSLISNNKIADNYCNGIWCDQGISNGIIEKNEIIRNEESGLNIEIGKATSGIIRDNTFDNNVNGIKLVTSGGVTITNNKFGLSTDSDIKTVIFARTADKWDSNNVIINNNFFGNSNIYMAVTPNDPLIPASRFIGKNTYSCETSQAKFQLLDKPKLMMNQDEWEKYWV